MSDPRMPHEKHSDDVVTDDDAPTDAVTDEVREESAKAESGPDQDIA